MQQGRRSRLPLGVVAALVLGFGTFSQALADEEFEQRLERLENILDGDRLVELIQQINDLEEQVRELRGSIEEQGHQLDQLRQRQRNLYADLDQRLRALEVEDRQTASSDVTPTTLEQAIDAPDPDAGESEQDAYDAALNLLREGRYADATEAFEAFLDNHADSGYAANAQYWVGETHYVSRDFSAALDAFRVVLSDYPDSNKVPDAMLKIGYTLYELGEYSEARDILNDVRDNYEGSSVARLAEERLVRMREEGV